MWANSTGFAVIQGLATALDTLMAQAYGAGVYLRLGRLAQRGFCILAIVCVPISLSWWFSGYVMQHLGQDSQTVALAERYCRALLPGLLPAVAFEVAKKYLQAQGIVWPTMAAAAGGALFNGILAVTLVFHSSLGLMGAPVATASAYWAMACISLAYCVWLHLARRGNPHRGYAQLDTGRGRGGRAPRFRQVGSEAELTRQAAAGARAADGGGTSGGGMELAAVEVGTQAEAPDGGALHGGGGEQASDPSRMPITWGGFSWSACWSSEGWVEFLGLGLPGMLMSVMEWAVYEAASIAAGLLGKEQLAAHSVLAQAGALSYMVPLGVSVAAGVRVGQMLGSRDLDGAKRATVVAVCLGWGSITVTASLFFLARRPWADAFSDDSGVQQVAVRSMGMVVMFTLLDQYQCILSGILRGMGRQAAGAAVNVVSYLAAELPLAFVLSGPAGLGLNGVWLGCFVGVVLSSSLLTWLTWQSDWEGLSDAAVARATGGQVEMATIDSPDARKRRRGRDVPGRANRK